MKSSMCRPRSHVCGAPTPLAGSAQGTTVFRMGNLSREKKRTTITTIETHEVWIVRQVARDLPDEIVAAAPLEPALPDGAVPSTRASVGGGGTIGDGVPIK